MTLPQTFREDWEFLVRNKALPEERMTAVETGGCPHAAIREDYSLNMEEVRDLTRKFDPEVVIIESGGDNLAANFSRELADYIIYIIDVAGGDKIPRKGGPGITQSDLLVVNKTDLAEAVGADLKVMERDAAMMRQSGPTLFTQAKNMIGIPEICDLIMTAEDWEFLVRNKALPEERMTAVETGGCPHAAIREDYSLNMEEVRDLTRKFDPEVVIIESGGDNLAANFSRELADYIIYIIDVAGGDKIPRKGGPGITQSDLLVVNKTDLAEAVGADLKVMERDAAMMRQSGPTLFTQAKNMIGIPEICDLIMTAYKQSVKKST
ncbi:ureG [Mytilus edulis]|uniref:UreG n=1 Tax=Mytilus edulis TaxID=6550 RepID=A0A8S3QGZ5_MYTED|nr:ureG [Mytilus edulis]